MKTVSHFENHSGFDAVCQKKYKIQKSNFTNTENDTSKIEAPKIQFQVLNKYEAYR